MKMLTLDTSCVMNLLIRLEEGPDEALLRILRLALERRVSIAVTHVAALEVPASHPTSGYVRERLQAFPAREVSPARAEEHERLAQQIERVLWPNAQPGSATSDHNRRDARHLAAHKLCGGSVFVTRDQDVSKKVSRHPELGLVVKSPADVVQELEHESVATKPAIATDIAVRAARDDDSNAIKALLRPVADLYPDFDAWLAKSLHDQQARVALGTVEGEIAGISVWKRKDRRVAKLATFFIAENFRQGGLGPHLLFHQLREWVEARIEKVVVTVASRLTNILPFFFQYGFRLEGAAGRRYKPGECELVLAKHFSYQRVATPDLASFVVGALDIFALPEASEARNAGNWFVEPRRDQPHYAVVQTAGAVELRSEHDQVVRLLEVGELDELFYPARFGIDTRKAFMIPIRPVWAERMMPRSEASRPQLRLFNNPVDKLLLRTDNAYYCHPRYGPARLRHAPVLFYVSEEIGAVTGLARVLECHVETPEDLFVRFGDIGIYGLKNIQEHVKKAGADRGHAMALRFGWWVPLPKPVSRAELERLGLAHPQTITSIPFASYEEVLAAGGLEW